MQLQERMNKLELILVMATDATEDQMIEAELALTTLTAGFNTPITEIEMLVEGIRAIERVE